MGSFPQDAVSCNDTIVEDGSWDFYKTGSWYVNGLFGYGDHSLTHLNAVNQNDSVSVRWYPRYLQTGTYSVYAYIPPMTDAQGHLPTENAKYTIHLNYGETIDKIVNQRTNADRWVFLGSYYLWQYSYVEMTTYTTDQLTTLVGADAIKVRCYRTFLPMTKR